MSSGGQGRSNLARLGRRVSMALMLRKKSHHAGTSVAIHLMDGSQYEFNIRPSTTVNAVCVALRKELALESDVDYGIAVLTDGVFVHVDGDVAISTIIPKLPVFARSSAKFYYKRRFFIDGSVTERLEAECENARDAPHRLLFTEAVYHFLRGHYRFGAVQVASLAALLLQAVQGNQFPDATAEELLSRLDSLCPDYVFSSEDTASTLSPQTLAESIIKQHGALKGMPHLQAQQSFLSVLKSTPAFGSDFYPAQRTWRDDAKSEPDIVLKSRAKDVTVGINGQGIHVLYSDDPLKIESHPFDTLTKWVVSRNNKIYAFAVDNNQTIFLVTQHAPIIGAAVGRYVAELLLLRGGAARQPHAAADADTVTDFTFTQAMPFRFIRPPAPPRPLAPSQPAPADGGEAERRPSTHSSTSDTDAAGGAESAAVPATATVAAMGAPAVAPRRSLATISEGAALDADALVASSIGGSDHDVLGTASDSLAAMSEEQDKLRAVQESLPPGWEALVCDDGIYYHNMETQETTWELPTAPASAAAALQAVNEELPDGWEAATADDGMVYYINLRTGTTQWERPAVQALPPGWQAFTDDDGDVYYWHSETNTTQWTFPTA